MSKLGALATVAALTTLTTAGRCGPPKPYHSPAGFSITPPVGWKAMDPQSTEQLHDTVVEKYKVKMGDSHFALVLFDQAGTSFTNNINVVVNPTGAGGDPTEEDAEKYASHLQSELQESGLAAKTLYAKIAPYCGHDAIEAESEFTMRGQKIHDLQVIIEAAGKRFVVTGSSLDDTFSELRPTFKKAVSSMKIDGDTGPSSRSLPPLLRDALVGAGIGAGIALVFAFARRR